MGYFQDWIDANIRAANKRDAEIGITRDISFYISRLKWIRDEKRFHRRKLISEIDRSELISEAMIGNRYSFRYDFVYRRIEKSANLLASQLSTEIWQMLKNQISHFPTRTRRGTCRSIFFQFLWIFFDTLYAWQWLILASKGLFLFLLFLFTDRSPQNLTKSSFFIWKLIESHADYRLSLKSNAAQQNIDAYLFA